MNLRLVQCKIKLGLQWAGGHQWGSHFQSVCNLIRMFDPTCSVLKDIIDEGTSYSQCGDTSSAYDLMIAFKFVFILHLMKGVLWITHILC